MSVPMRPFIEANGAMSDVQPGSDPMGSFESIHQTPSTALVQAPSDPTDLVPATDQYVGWRGLAERLLDVADQVGESIRRALLRA